MIENFIGSMNYKEGLFSEDLEKWMFLIWWGYEFSVCLEHNVLVTSLFFYNVEDRFPRYFYFLF